MKSKNVSVVSCFGTKFLSSQVMVARSNISCSTYHNRYSENIDNTFVYFS